MDLEPAHYGHAHHDRSSRGCGRGALHIERRADEEMLPFSRTAGGHRQCERFGDERLFREQPVPVSPGDRVDGAWIRCVVEACRHEIDRCSAPPMSPRLRDTNAMSEKA